MNKRYIFITLISLCFLSFFFYSFVQAKYIINEEIDITASSVPMNFNANAENEYVVMDTSGANIKINIKNYLNDTQIDSFSTSYAITLENNDKFVLEENIVKTLVGGSKTEDNITLRITPQLKNILNSEENVIIRVTSSKPYKKVIDIPISINTDPNTISGMELNFIIKNKTYAPEGDVYEYYSLDTNRVKDYTVKKIIFGKYSDYQTEVTGLTAEALDVNRLGIINLYRKLNQDGTTYTIYILSNDGKFKLSQNASWTFDKLYALETIENLHLVDTSNVVEMRDMFCDCAVIKDIDLSNFNTSKVKNMIGMFARCEEIVCLDLLSFDVGNVTEINQAFSDCLKLKSIYVSSSWNLKTGTGYDTVNLFRGSVLLKGGNGTAYDATKLDGAMAKIDGSTKGYLSSLYNFQKGSNVNNLIKGKTQAEIDAWSLENRYQDTLVTKIIFGLRRDYDYLIEGYDFIALDNVSGGGIKAYRIPNGNGTYTVYIITNSGEFIANTDSAWFFDKFTKLIAIENLPLLNVTKVVNMRDMFCDCQSLPSLDLSNFNTVSATTYEGLFARMYMIETIDISKFSSSNITTMLNMFYAGISAADTLPEYQNVVPKLKTIYASSSWNPSKADTVSSVFYNATSLVGGNGTVFNASNVTVTYARIDTAQTPGYFTAK